MTPEEKIKFLQSCLDGREAQVRELKEEVARKEPLLKQMDNYAADMASMLDNTLQQKLKQEYVIGKLLERINTLERRVLIAQAERDAISDERQRDILMEMGKPH